MISNLTQLLEEAQKLPCKKIAIAAAADPYVLNAINKAKEAKLIAPIYIANKTELMAIASKLNINIETKEIIDVPNDEIACIEAVKLVSEGKADLLMKGLVSTGTLLKQVVNKNYGLLSGKLLSHLAIFESPNYSKLLGVTDAAMNVSPNVDEKISIANNAINVFHSLGNSKPKLAILAAVEKINPKIQATLDAASIKEKFIEEKNDSCYIDGPFALDNAISNEAAKHKGIESPVAGDADILLAPDLNTGNVLYKCLSFLGNARCAAVITGSKAPIILTSRADTEETKYLSIALACVMHQFNLQKY